MMPMPSETQQMFMLSRPPTPRPPSPATEQMAALLLGIGIHTEPSPPVVQSSGLWPLLLARRAARSAAVGARFSRPIFSTLERSVAIGSRLVMPRRSR